MKNALLLAAVLCLPAAAQVDPENPVIAEHRRQAAAVKVAAAPCAEVAEIRYREVPAVKPAFFDYRFGPSSGSGTVTFVNTGDRAEPLEELITRDVRCAVKSGEFAALAAEINKPAFFALNERYIFDSRAAGLQELEVTIVCADGSRRSASAQTGMAPPALQSVLETLRVFVSTRKFE